MTDLLGPAPEHFFLVFILLYNRIYSGILRVLMRSPGSPAPFCTLNRRAGGCAGASGCAGSDDSTPRDTARGSSSLVKGLTQRPREWSGELHSQTLKCSGGQSCLFKEHQRVGAKPLGHSSELALEPRVPAHSRCLDSCVGVPGQTVCPSPCIGPAWCPLLISAGLLSRGRIYFVLQP